MKIRCLATAVALSALSTCHAWAQSAPSRPLPLFEAFQSYCTKGDGSAVETALTKGNATRVPLDPAQIAKAAAAKGMTDLDMSMWDVSVPEHKMVLTLMVAKKGAPSVPKQFVFNCIIASTVNEDDSMAAAAKWAGVAPIQITTPDQQKMYVFTFEVQDGQHLILQPGTPEAQDAAAKGRIWVLLTATMKVGGILSLIQMAPKDPPPQ